MDKITFTFNELAQKELPLLLKSLNDSKAYIVSDLLGKNLGVAAALKKTGKDKDFAGLYISIETANEQVIYTGISRTVLSRLNQHVNIRNHNAASFAYKIAKEKQGYTGKRATFQKEHITTEQTILHQYKVKFIEIEDTLTRYLFEVYVAMHFDTPYNTFETS